MLSPASCSVGIEPTGHTSESSETSLGKLKSFPRGSTTTLDGVGANFYVAAWTLPATLRRLGGPATPAVSALKARRVDLDALVEPESGPLSTANRVAHVP